MSSSPLKAILRRIDVNPLSPGGRGLQVLGLIVTPLVTLVTLAAYCISNISHDTASTLQRARLTRDINSIVSSLELVLVLEREHAMMVTYQVANQTEVIGSFEEYFHQTDIAMQHIQHWPDILSTRTEFTDALWEYRALYTLNNEMTVDPAHPLDPLAQSFYERAIYRLLSWESHGLFDSGRSAESAFRALYHLIQAIPIAGVESLSLTLYYLYGHLSHDLYDQYVTSSHGTQLHINMSLEHEHARMQWHGESGSIDNLEPKNFHTLQLRAHENERIERNLHTAFKAFRLFDYRMSLIHELAIHVAALILEEIDDKQWDFEGEIILSAFGLAICLGFAMFLVMAGHKNTITLYIYAVSLEKQTLELRREKRKIDNILLEMLPRGVAYRLRQGRLVEAEEFEQATIFFSDIADFTHMSGQMEPMQIIELLNAIYCFFDAQINEYDVYKVETIGCVYMVVSGLPSRNKSRHVSEIARMSLDLLQRTQAFQIPYFKQNILQLRIGFHTGPVVAGVVGNKAPRYCLFGDTVNVASRMQSSGEARKIHLSSQSMHALMENGGFTVIPRGTVEIKGKGYMSTYWLVGRSVEEDGLISAPRLHHNHRNNTHASSLTLSHTPSHTPYHTPYHTTPRRQKHAVNLSPERGNGTT